MILMATFLPQETLNDQEYFLVSSHLIHCFCFFGGGGQFWSIWQVVDRSVLAGGVKKMFTLGTSHSGIMFGLRRKSPRREVVGSSAGAGTI